jgi:hypothetical protein
MANPNLINVTDIRGNTAYVLPSVTTAGQTNWTHNGSTALTGLTPAANSVNKINSIVVTNLTGSNASLYVSIANNATWGSGTAYYIAYNITVPPTSSIIVTDRTNYFYVTENQSVAVQTGTASALSFVASFEVIT